MKKLRFPILLLLGLLFAPNILAQVGINKDNSPPATDAILHVRGSGNQDFFIHDISGNVGIGTTSPDQKLHVVGGVKLAAPMSGSLSDSLLVWSTADSTLKIISPAALNINSRAFSTLSGVTSNEPGDLANDDFVFGASALNYTGFYEDSRFFFDKSKSAFRAGRSGVFNWNADSLGMYSAAFGLETKAIGQYSFASGSASYALGEASTAIGRNTLAGADNATAMGSYAKAISENATAIGYFANATGLASLAIGYQNEASGDYATSLGHQSTASGESSFASGRLNTASGTYSSTFGYFNTTSGEGAMTAGYNLLASGDYSLAMGASNTASGNNAGAFGENSTATADFAYSFGSNCHATGIGSLAMGVNSTAAGDNSISLGQNCINNGYRSFTSGYANTLAAQGAMAIGTNLQNDIAFSQMFGSYNEVVPGSNNSWVGNDALFVVGRGGSPASRKNALWINKYGYMGIGTNAPTSKLTVRGPGTIVRLESEANDQTMKIHWNRIESDSTLFINSISKEAVTIGISYPADGYMLSVAGKMIAEEIRVQLSGSWPDYVFEEGYPLQSLPELEKEIKTLGHLPGIPSAAEVEKDGVHLGEMERKMMEKIEELTLHFIALDKRIEMLEKKKGLALESKNN